MMTFDTGAFSNACKPGAKPREKIEDETKFMAFFQLVDSSKIQNENSNAENAEFSYNKKNEYNMF